MCPRRRRGGGCRAIARVERAAPVRAIGRVSVRDCDDRKHAEATHLVVFIVCGGGAWWPFATGGGGGVPVVDASATAGDADLRSGGGATPGGSGLNLPPPPSMLMAGLAGLLVSPAAAAAVVVEAAAVALKLGERAPASDTAADGDGDDAAAGGAVGVAAPPPAAFFFAWNFLSWQCRRAGGRGCPLSACACSALLCSALLNAHAPFPLLARLWRRALPRPGRPHRPPWLLLTLQCRIRGEGKGPNAVHAFRSRAYLARHATGRQGSLQQVS